MPNWCNNNIKIEGPKDKIKNKAIKNKNKSL